MKILEGVAWQFGVKHSGVTKKTRFLSPFGAYNFRTFRAEAKVTIRRHELVYRLSSERKMIDLE